jgi:hypothetical protein
VAATAFAPAVFAPAGRDRATALVAALAVIALIGLPWSVGGGPPALTSALGGAGSFWPLIIGAAAALAFAALGRDTGTAVASGMALAWAFLAGFGASASFGFGAVHSAALTICLARALARHGSWWRRDGGDAGRRHRALLAIFIFFPVGKALFAAVLDTRRFAPALAAERLFTADIWALVLGRRTRCGRDQSALLATIVGIL